MGIHLAISVIESVFLQRVNATWHDLAGLLLIRHWVVLLFIKSRWVKERIG